jgi:hypothetical protein
MGCLFSGSAINSGSSPCLLLIDPERMPDYWREVEGLPIGSGNDCTEKGMWKLYYSKISG